MQLSLYKTLAGFHDDVTVLAWSHDSRFYFWEPCPTATVSTAPSHKGISWLALRTPPPASFHCNGRQASRLSPSAAIRTESSLPPLRRTR